MTQTQTVSDETFRKIDIEVRRIIDAAHDKATELLQSHRRQLDIMADALIKYETIDEAQIDQIMDGKIPDPPKDWSDPDDDDGGNETVSADSGESASSDDSEDADDADAVGQSA